MHESATSVSFFEHPSWIDFFTKLKRKWCKPPTTDIGGSLLGDVFKDLMSNMPKAVRSSGGVVLGIDVATKMISKSLSNIIVHKPTPSCVEYLKADLKTEKTSKVVSKLKDCISILDEQIGMSTIFALIADSGYFMRDVRKLLQEEHIIKYAY